MIKLFVALLTFGLSLTLFGQETFEVPEVPPEYPGGMENLYADLGELLLYPETAIDDGIEGKVYVQFIVSKEGSIKEVKVVKGVRSDLDSAALTVVGQLKDWTPGRTQGKNVAASYTLPINFSLKGHSKW